MKFTASIFKFRPFETGRNLRVEFRCRSFKSNALNACRKDILNLSLVIQEKSHRLTFSGCSLYGLANIFSFLRRKEECWNTGVNSEATSAYGKLQKSFHKPVFLHSRT